MKNQANNVVSFNNFKEVLNKNSQTPEVVYMPFIVYYPMYLTPQGAVSSPAAVEQPKKDNVVSIYEYLGEI